MCGKSAVCTRLMISVKSVEFTYCYRFVWSQYYILFNFPSRINRRKHVILDWNFNICYSKNVQHDSNLPLVSFQLTNLNYRTICLTVIINSANKNQITVTLSFLFDKVNRFECVLSVYILIPVVDHFFNPDEN